MIVQIKKMLAKKLGLPMMCLFFVSCLFIRQNIVYLRSTVSDNELQNVLLMLQRAQAQSRVLLVQTGNSSFLVGSNMFQNGSQDETEESSLKRTTRKWFDDRPDVNASKMAVSDHPLFPGYIIKNPDLCSDQKVDILVYLHSAAEHREVRRNIRETWGSPRTFSGINLKLLFILGKPNDRMVQHHVESEFASHRDIVQGNFSDTFRNLTYKAITLLAWVNAHCPQVRYLVKVDDDMFVDTYRVVSELVPKLSPRKSAVACDVKVNLPILRDPHIKWYVDQALLPGRSNWPQFCSGYFLVMTGDMIPRLYEASFQIKEYIPIDDAYLFGLLVEKITLPEFINIHDQISANERPEPDKEIYINGKFEFISFRVRSEDDHVKLWTLRSHKLSPWEQAHSRYFSLVKKLDPKIGLVV